MDKDTLRLIRKGHKLTQAEFGKRLGDGYSRQAVINWEAGTSRIPANIVAMLAKAELAMPAQQEKVTKAELARQEAEEKLIKHYVGVYRRLRAWPDIPNHNAAMRYLAKEGTAIPPMAYPAIVAAFPDILTDPDGNYRMSKEQSNATILGT